MERIYIQIRAYTKDNGLQAKDMVKELSIIQMAASMKVTGLIIRDKVQVYSLLL